MKKEQKTYRSRLLSVVWHFLSACSFAAIGSLHSIGCPYFFLYYLARYRRKVVRKNLTNTFPSKSKKEIEKIEKDFYRFLCDYFVETIKLLHISDKEIKQRMKFDNPELINELTQSGTSCFLCLGHYGNWEYVPSIGFYLSPNVVQGQIYKQLHNKTFDCFFLKIRSRFSPKCIEKGEVFRTIVKTKTRVGLW